MSSLDKQRSVNKVFYSLSPEEKYEKIIALGRALPIFPDGARVPENLVQGCQSVMYLETTFRDGRIYFNADSEALISKGLAALLIAAYSGEPPASLLQHPPSFLKDLGLSLSPARSNGLSSLYKKMLAVALLHTHA